MYGSQLKGRFASLLMRPCESDIVLVRRFPSVCPSGLVFRRKMRRGRIGDCSIRRQLHCCVGGLLWAAVSDCIIVGVELPPHGRENPQYLFVGSMKCVSKML